MTPCELSNRLLHLPRARYERCLSSSTSGQDLAEMWPGCDSPQWPCNFSIVVWGAFPVISLWSCVFKLHYSNTWPSLDQTKLRKKTSKKQNMKTWHRLTPAHNGRAQAIALIMAMPSASLMRLLRQCGALDAPKVPISTIIFIYYRFVIWNLEYIKYYCI